MAFLLFFFYWRALPNEEKHRVLAMRMELILLLFLDWEHFVLTLFGYTLVTFLQLLRMFVHDLLYIAKMLIFDSFSCH
jgi:hypothetical protein